MSRIGKRPVIIPDGVKVTVTDNKLKITGPKGELERVFHKNLTVKVDEANKKIMIGCLTTTKEDKAIYGSSRSITQNMVIGVTQGFEKKIEIHGTGYNGKLQGTELVINIGFSHPVKTQVPKGLTVTLPNPNLVVIQGTDKELVGQFSANIRNIKLADPYNLKGTKYADEVIKRKAGKTFVSGT